MTTDETPTTATVTANTDSFTNSFEAVYAQLQPLVLRLARQELQVGPRGTELRTVVVYGAQGVSPEDIAQQTWLQVWRNWDTLRGRDLRLITAYTLRTAKHLVIDHQRRRGMAWRTGERPMNQELQEDVIDRLSPTDVRADQPETAFLDAEAVAEAVALAVRVAAHRSTSISKLLAPKVLVSLLLDETPAETAARLGISYNAAKTAVWRLRHLLRDHRAALTSGADGEADADGTTEEARDEASA